MSTLRDDLIELVGKPNNNAEICIVRFIDEDTRTCTCEPISHPTFEVSSPEPKEFYYNVRYSPSPSEATNTPSPNSYIVTMKINNDEVVVVLMSAVSDYVVEGPDGVKIDIIAKIEAGDDLVIDYIHGNCLGISTVNGLATGSDFKGFGKYIAFDYASYWFRTSEGAYISAEKDIVLSASKDSKIKISANANIVENPESRKSHTIDDVFAPDNSASTVGLEKLFIDVSVAMYRPLALTNPASRTNEMIGIAQAFDKRTFNTPVPGIIKELVELLKNKSIVNFLISSGTEYKLMIEIMKVLVSLNTGIKSKRDEKSKSGFTVFKQKVLTNLKTKLPDLLWKIYRAYSSNDKRAYFQELVLDIIEIVGDDATRKKKLTKSSVRKIEELFRLTTIEFKDVRTDNATINVREEEVVRSKYLDAIDDLTLGFLMQGTIDIIERIQGYLKSDMTELQVAVAANAAASGSGATFSSDIVANDPSIISTLDDLKENIDKLLY